MTDDECDRYVAEGVHDRARMVWEKLYEGPNYEKALDAASIVHANTELARVKCYRGEYLVRVVI